VILPLEVWGDFVPGDVGWRSGSPLRLKSPHPDGFRGCLKKTGSYQDIASAIPQILRNETQIGRVARVMAPEQFPRRFNGRSRSGSRECLAVLKMKIRPAAIRIKGQNLRC